MKKLRFFSMWCLLALIIGFLVGCQKNTKNDNTSNSSLGGGVINGGVYAGYVDLGLPSGTKWKAFNEIGNGSGFYTYDEAMSTFGSELPSKKQLEELVFYCTWEWQNNSCYKVTGSNGNYIFLSAAGYNTGTYTNYESSNGHYWSSTPISQAYAWSLVFGDEQVYMSTLRSRDYRLTIRLVRN